MVDTKLAETLIVRCLQLHLKMGQVLEQQAKYQKELIQLSHAKVQMTSDHPVMAQSFEAESGGSYTQLLQTIASFEQEWKDLAADFDQVTVQLKSLKDSAPSTSSVPST